MEAEKIDEIKVLINQLKSDASLVHHPSLSFFRTYILSLGASIPPLSTSGSHVILDDEAEDPIVESDIELDETDVVEPDNDPPLSMGDPSVEVSEENQDAAQALKSKALVALSDGQVDEALGLLTDAIMLNPCSAILYATRGNVLLKLKKPNAAIQDANAAFQINPDSAKAYKVRGMARAMLGMWEDAAKDLRIASKLDYDEDIDSVLRKVESNANKIESHRRKYVRLRNEREVRKNEREKQRQREAQAAQLKSSLKDGHVISTHSKTELEKRLTAAAKLDRLAILYFTATWCGPCRTISPVYSTLAAKYPHVVFLKVDIDEVRDAAAKWNVASVPTFFFVKNGKEMDRVVGADKSSLEKKIAQYT
ncbi:hypothetical protein RND81_08G011700 [Saponaria officinalis]|uniref:TPR repeat-containing thioredoxin TDX n=1 Tax=Saponaria officinalis TaxID=3572 RepID=A0AAW1J2L9_SAPOF